MVRVMEVGSGRFGQMVAGMEHIQSMGGRNTFDFLGGTYLTCLEGTLEAQWKQRS
jgi:hypothetical protein